MTAKPLAAATDGSERALRAVEWAAREAVVRGVRLRIAAATRRGQRPIRRDRATRPAHDPGNIRIAEQRTGKVRAASRSVMSFCGPSFGSRGGAPRRHR